MSPRTPVLRHALRLLGAALAAVALALLAVGAAPAGAHGGDGEVEVRSLTRDGDEVTVDVHAFYTGDGHGVPDATVTVVVDDGTPVPMSPGAEEGDYTATVTAAPGARILVTSVEPPATAEAQAPEADTDATTSEPAATDSTDATEVPDTSVPTTTAAADGSDDEVAATPVAAEGDDDGGSSGGVAIALVALVVVAAGAAAFFVLRKPAPDA